MPTKFKVTPEKSIPLYLDIIEKNPKTIESLRGLSAAYLMQGDYVNGWKTHLQLHESHLNRLQALIQNNEVSNKKVLLIYQGGLGDTFNFIRYAKRLKKLGAIVIAFVQTPLVHLLSRCPFIDRCISKKNYVLSRVASTCDVYAQIMNLPALFEDTETTIPSSVPYVFPDHKLIEQWKKIVNKTTFNIGICWHPDTQNDEARMSIARRDIPLPMFEKLQNISNVHFYSLQKKDGLDQINQINAQFPLTVIDDALLDGDHGPFMDTAAIIANLDLVITIDSAVAHLAGALGKPVWLLLPYATDWRWLINRTDSPWYPTMRIFKQPAPFDWNSVMENVYTELCLINKNK